MKTLFTSKMDLHLMKNLVKCYISSIALYGAGTSESRSEIAGTFWNVVLEKDKDHQADRLYDKWGCITCSQRGEKYTYNEKNVMLEKDGEDQLELPCEKWGCITQIQGEQKYPT